MTVQTLQLDYGIFNRPSIGERVSGDTGIVLNRGNLIFLGIIDVLGHGPEAHELARQIETFLRKNWKPDVVATMNHLHSEIKGSRGAAAGLGVFDTATNELSYAGVGNTMVRKLGSRAAQLYSVDGIVGTRMRQPVEQKLHMINSDVILMYSDGVSDRFGLDDYPQLLYESATAIARNIVHRFGKVYDDATCVVLRYKK
jgi:serine phosphatase RsbU (regulator of sigma subunit)